MADQPGSDKERRDSPEQDRNREDRQACVPAHHPPPLPQRILIPL
jgi:hypothetical protein